MTKFFNETIEHDFNNAQRQSEQSEYLEGYDVRDVYRNRPEHVRKFEGTYEVAVERVADYNDFIEVLMDDAGETRNTFSIKKQALKLNDLEERTRAEFTSDIERAEVKMAFINAMTIEQWQSNKTIDGKKLGKAMMKAGFSKGVLDYYSAQVRDNTTVYLTITSAPQAIVGMTNYADGWTSCQSTMGGDENSRHILGALHDENLVIMALHENLSGRDDLDGRMMARVTARVFEHNGVDLLVPNRIYGNNVGHNIMQRVLDILQGMKIGIVSSQYDVSASKAVRVWDHSKQTFTYGYSTWVNFQVYETFDLKCECPVCEGEGTVEATVTRMQGDDYSETYTQRECPTCSGSGVYVYEVDIDDSIEDDDYEVESFGSYEDGSLRYENDCVSMLVDAEAVAEQVRAQYERDARDDEEI